MSYVAKFDMQNFGLPCATRVAYPMEGKLLGMIKRSAELPTPRLT
jgi:hypothetical protein